MPLSQKDAAQLRQNYLDKREKLLQKKVDGLALSLFDKVYTEYLSQLEETDGRISNNGKNISSVQGLDSIYKKFNANENIPVVKSFVKDLQGLTPINEAYFKTISTKPTSEAAKVAIKEVNGMLGINEKGGLVSEGFADKFIQDKTLLKRIKKETLKAITQKKGFQQLKDDLKRTIEGETGKPLSGGLQQYYRAYAYDTYNKVDRVNADIFADKLGMIYFIWAGGKILTSRNICVSANAKIFNALEVKRMKYENLKPEFREGISKDWVPLRDLGMHNCRHRKDFISDEQAAKQRDRWASVNHYLINPISLRNARTMTKEQWKQFKDFPRDKNLTGEMAKLQDDSIKSFITNKDILTKEYIDRFKNVVNTDDARKLFTDVGYSGINAQGVHEASSAVSKEALKKLLRDSELKTVEMYAGGAGSGKTSSIEGLRQGLKEKSAAIIDGNMSSYESALKKMDQMLSSGKEINISYAYRDPEDAWKNGVIKRMLSNKEEMGRTVKISTFLENTEGSYNTIKQMYADGIDKKEGVRIHLIDNSLGKDKADFMSKEKFDLINYSSDLRSKLIKITKEMYNSGQITKAQYDALIL